MRELQDLLDMFPYFLLVLLPVFIVISPYNPVEAAQDFPVHRMTHYEFGGQVFGSKLASISLEARAIGAQHVLRKMVVAKITEVSVSSYQSLVESGAGGLLLLVPALNQSRSGSGDTDTAIGHVPADVREAVLTMEEYFRGAGGAETKVPVFVAEETEELLQLHQVLAEESASNKESASAAQALLNGIISNGYQMVSSSSNPKPLADQTLLTLQGIQKGRGDDENLPTILLVAHYDADGMAPSLAYGADSNGSGVTIMMELARLFKQLYMSTQSQPDYNMVYLLTGGGAHLNYYGTKRWLDEMKDNQQSDLLASTKFIVCLDSLGRDPVINVHVSKPPKGDTPANKFYKDLQIIAAKSGIKVNLVHKKINLANEYLAWEHERFSIAKLPGAMSLSHYDSPFNGGQRSTILDRTVDQAVVLRNTRLLAEALACSVYNLKSGDVHECRGDVFNGTLGPQPEALAAWTDQMSAQPRGPSLVAGAKNNPTVDLLSEALEAYTHKVKKFASKRDQSEQDYVYFDVQRPATMSAYKVKPAVFDLVLAAFIAAYLGLVHLVLGRVNVIFALLEKLTKMVGGSGGGKKPETNGNSHNGKVKAH